MKHCLLGALWGDICGSPYEFNSETDPHKVSLSHPQRHFTDDSVLTLAVAKAILEKRPYRDTILELALRYPNSGFGQRFMDLWILQRKPEPYSSFGNGSAMRVSPVAWAFNTIEDVVREATATAECSHNHPEGIRIAQAVAVAIFLARKGHDKEDIADLLEENFQIPRAFSMDEVREREAAIGWSATYTSIPGAINTFMCTDSFEECIRQAIALGGDADTQAAIAGSIAEAYYGPDEAIAAHLPSFLPTDLLKIYQAFATKYGQG
ncbi:MAG: ADP-ribosylglycohydrolase family protein [bacterium]|nr:ADP-ribosylglycohydrolase family protein [bacterium]